MGRTFLSAAPSKPGMRRALIAITAGVTLAGLPASAAYQDTEHITRTVSLDPGGVLRLKSFSGRVTIIASDQI